jgi:hypothetical protein
MTKIDTITKRQTRKLIRALESGEYRKTKEKLCNKQGTAFCCLGVYADIQGAEWDKDSYGNLFPVGNYRQPEDVNSINIGSLEKKWAGGLSDNTQGKLARINDDNKTFAPVIKYLKDFILPKAK